MPNSQVSTTESTKLIKNYVEGENLKSDGEASVTAGYFEFTIGGITLTTLGLHMLVMTHPHVTAAVMLGHSVAAIVGSGLTIDGAIRMAAGSALYELGSDYCRYATENARRAGMTLFSRRPAQPAANAETPVITGPALATA